MTTHTPTPWTMRESNFAFHIYGEFQKSKNAFITASYWTNPHYGPSRAEAEANARLIAAAPDLLASLKELEPFMHEGAALLRAREAIAKAEGTI